MRRHEGKSSFGDWIESLNSIPRLNPFYSSEVNSARAEKGGRYKMYNLRIWGVREENIEETNVISEQMSQVGKVWEKKWKCVIDTSSDHWVESVSEDMES